MKTDKEYVKEFRTNTRRSLDAGKKKKILFKKYKISRFSEKKTYELSGLTIINNGVIMGTGTFESREEVK